MAAAIPLIIAAGSAAYSAHEQHKLASAQRDAAGKAADALKNQPKGADVGSMESSQAQAQRQAETAGGTILSNPSENKRNIGTAVQPPKTLLGA